MELPISTVHSQAPQVSPHIRCLLSWSCWEWLRERCYQWWHAVPVYIKDRESRKGLEITHWVIDDFKEPPAVTMHQETWGWVATEFTTSLWMMTWNRAIQGRLWGTKKDNVTHREKQGALAARSHCSHKSYMGRDISARTQISHLSLHHRSSILFFSHMATIRWPWGQCRLSDFHSSLACQVDRT